MRFSLPMNKNTYAKFNTLGAAENFKNRADKVLAIILGNDGFFWVVTLSEMVKLEKQGFQIA